MNALLLAHAMVTRFAAPAAEDVKPGGLALVIVLLMGLATYLLWRSMNRQLKKVDFDDGSAPREAEPETGTEQQVDRESRDHRENGEQPV
jgi:ABC-type nickel/cobalt efflux system permease component RcnA